MKVFNLTDVPTDALRRNGLLNVSFTLAGTTVAPGGSEEVANSAKNEANSFVLLEALSIGKAPEAYLAQKKASAGIPKAAAKAKAEAEAKERAEADAKAEAKAEADEKARKSSRKPRT